MLQRVMRVSSACGGRFIGPALVMGGLMLQATWAGPIVPGYERLTRERPGDSAAFRGEILMGELNCVACHSGVGPGESRVDGKEAPDLQRVGARLTPAYLRRLIAAPHETRPGTTMPDLFHGMDETERAEAIDSLVHFLVSQGGPMSAPRSAGAEHIVERGQELFNSIGCRACHTEGTVEGLDGELIPLTELPNKTTVDELTQFLQDPLKVRPAGRMPDFRLDEQEARAIAIYLLRDQLHHAANQEVAPAKEPGLEWAYYEEANLSVLPDFEALTPKAQGAIDTFTLELPTDRRGSNFAIRFRGTLAVPEAGRYTFETVSDDGTRLRIGATEVVDNDGVHPMQSEQGEIRLDEGEHPIVLEYFQGGGEIGLQVAWSGPATDGEKEPIPSDSLFRQGGHPMIPLEETDFDVDANKVAQGVERFGALGCASCHTLDGTSSDTALPELSELDPEAEGGCLSEAVAAGVPDYDLGAGQRAALRSALRQRRASDRETPLSAEQVVQKTMARLNCYACHERGDVGGPVETQRDFFQTAFPIDLGEEGRMPPPLDGVGAKFKSAALKAVVADGERHVRHYMATRMPDFGEVNIQPFLDHVGEADRLDPEERFEPQFSEEAVEIGRQLVGTSGLSCVTCHRIAGEPALAIDGIDLASVYARLTPSWFHGFLLDPGRFKEETRMPRFWPNGQSPFSEVADGDTDAQINGIWAYLSLGESMSLPEGVDPEGVAAMELIPEQEPIIHRTFMEGVGPRAIVVGYPEKVHVAFDAHGVRLAKAWRGRFFDASGVASGRTDEFLGPLGHEVLDLPPGPAFAWLNSEREPWPKGERGERNLGGEFGGYRLDAQGRPIFWYELQGVRIQEQPLPKIQPGGGVLIRRFRLETESAAPARELYYLAAVGRRIEPKRGLTFEIDGQRQVRLDSPHPLNPILRNREDRVELLVPIAFEDRRMEFEQTIEW